MRLLISSLATAAAVGILNIAGVAPASAYDYPYCLQDEGFNIPGDCSYQTYAQCRASASGRYATCAMNPRAAYARTPYGRTLRDRRGPPPDRLE
jgi:Protein of unknown function (DUF3551)